MCKKIDVKAMCLFKYQNQFLFSKHRNQRTNQAFFRPLGGNMEFQEASEDTIRREMLEELGAELTDLTFVDILEDIFEYKGETLHQIVFIYQANFKDKRFYHTNPIDFQEADLAEHQAEWFSLAHIQQHDFNLVPAGIKEVILSTYPQEA